MDFQSAGKFRGHCYCTFCKTTVDNPTIVPLKQRSGYGRTKIWWYLCPVCGGQMVLGAKARGTDPIVDGVTRIRTKKGK